MEIFNPSPADLKAYRAAIFQTGNGYDKDGYYIYQTGEGLSSFFGGLMKSAIPLLSRSIKGIARISAPHIKNAGRDIVTAGSKRLLQKLSGDVVKKIEQPRTKKRKRRRI